MDHWRSETWVKDMVPFYISVSEETSIRVSAGSHSVEHKSNHNRHWRNARRVSGSPRQATQPRWSLTPTPEADFPLTVREGTDWRAERSLLLARPPQASFSLDSEHPQPVVSADHSKGGRSSPGSVLQTSRRLGKLCASCPFCRTPFSRSPAFPCISSTVPITFWNDLVPLFMFWGQEASMHLPCTPFCLVPCLCPLHV